MRIIFCSLLIVWLFAGLQATGQSISQAPSLDPFRIERGSSFSASSERRPQVNETVEPKPPAISRITEDLAEAIDLIKDNYIDGKRVEARSLTKASINSMLGELDPHSSYYDPTEFQVLLGDQESEYSGTGSSITSFVRNGKIDTFIVSVQPGSAAARAGMTFGDRILSVDGIQVAGSTIDSVRDRIRGPRGTTVRIELERASTGSVETLEVKRERVLQPTIADFYMLRDGVGYIDLSEGFSLTTSAELERSLRELKRLGMRSLILDLRGNTGGVLDQAIRVAESFLPAGRTIISQRGRSAEDNATWKSANPSPTEVPLVLLVNERTASASEVVAGALQDNDRALIVGRSTYGKSLVQKVLGLGSGSGLTLTTARYYTPSGRSIQRNYTSGRLYDYYQHHENGDRGSETRTITNRPVFGGKGITPDEQVDSERFNLRRASLIDPIFFFVRKVLREESQRGQQNSPSSSVIQSKDGSYLNGFRAFASSDGWNIGVETLDQEEAYIERQLRYQFALALKGHTGAVRIRNESDPEIAKALVALPKAKLLAESAQRMNPPVGTKKPAGSHSRAGQGRNRRN